MGWDNENKSWWHHILGNVPRSPLLWREIKSTSDNRDGRVRSVEERIPKASFCSGGPLWKECCGQRAVDSWWAPGQRPAWHPTPKKSCGSEKSPRKETWARSWLCGCGPGGRHSVYHLRGPPFKGKHPAGVIGAYPGAVPPHGTPWLVLSRN